MALRNHPKSAPSTLAADQGKEVFFSLESQPNDLLGASSDKPYMQIQKQGNWRNVLPFLFAADRQDHLNSDSSCSEQRLLGHHRSLLSFVSYQSERRFQHRGKSEQRFSTARHHLCALARAQAQPADRAKRGSCGAI